MVTSPGAASASPLPRPGDQAWSVALHVHGSFSEGDGSMEWHTDMAQRWGVDAIWWTDHDWRMENHNHLRAYGFEEATYDAGRGTITEPDEAAPGESKTWVRVEGESIGAVEIVSGFAYEGSRSLRLTVADDENSPEFRPYSFRQGASRKHNRYSLASRVRLGLAIYPEVFDPADDKFVVEVRLSLHPEEQPVLRYVAGSMEGEDADAIPLAYTANEWSAYEMDVTQDAIARFSTGGIDSLRVEDNSLFEVVVGLETRRGNTAVVFFDDYRVEWDSSLTGDDLLDKQRDMAARYEEVFTDVRQFVGTEISRFRPQPHLNAYGTDLRLVEYGAHPPEEKLFYAVEQVHVQGGIVSLNHAFGPWVYADPTETPAEREVRLLDQTRRVLGDRALGCDMFEVGYRRRGGASLDDHLRLWDVLTANAFFLTGDGVSDTHGTTPFNGWGPWQTSYAQENNFVTWVWSESLSEPALVRALRGGRAFFGDPNQFPGTVDLMTGEGFPMGRVVLTDRESHTLHVRIEELPVGASVRLVQMEIREDPSTEYLEPNVLRDELLSGTTVEGVFEAQVELDASLASFARVEVHNDIGWPLVFSNPVYFVRELPAGGVAAPRVAASLGGLTVEDVRGFDVTGVTLERGARQLTIQGWAAAEGQGSLTIGTGARGVPARVSGADSWSWKEGTLSMAGLAGGISSIGISWVREAEAPEPVREIALAPGRPNPSGGGTRAPFALPRATHVRLRVLDVRGHLVRTLVDEMRSAGQNAATWDGRDQSGRPVASGVYFLRLDADGEVHTAKAVVLR
jgi:hypothetical protein